MPPVYYEPIPSGVFFRVDNQQLPPQSFPASYPQPPDYIHPPSHSHPHTSITRNSARQQSHGHRPSMARNHPGQHGHSRPSHMRSSITARRWMVRINAIQQPAARSNNTAERNQSIITSGTTSISQQTQTQPPPYPPTDGPDSTRREGDQQDDERVNREMERGFQVLWGRGD
jgi:hypothetical protein